MRMDGYKNGYSLACSIQNALEKVTKDKIIP